jgi:hypothetical protein
MRSDTVSLAPGSDGVAGGRSAGLVVAALKAFSAKERVSGIGCLAMALLYHVAGQKVWHAWT